MKIMTSYGKEVWETAKAIYKSSRWIVDMGVKNGRIKPTQSQLEWAKLVKKGLIQAGMKVPKAILEILTK